MCYWLPYINKSSKVNHERTYNKYLAYDSFPTAQFQMKGFSVPYRYDRNGKGGGLLLYIREDIQSKLLISKSKCNIETLSVAVNLRKRKWFLNCSYNPYQNLISNRLECLNRFIDEHCSSFDNFTFIEDFTLSTNHTSMINFCDLNGLKILLMFQHVTKILSIQPVLI